ncbi:hypothetical protein FUAX_09190 [Fulvitalea axinellae]|uniref:LamG-like jellyroll fold domain-containing protein n=2 Tax=Fulvitalea axinellae TaxID=1182444 RepID=A0AAU9CKN6_9BACT|nr:hypothetical protein FUAX_09190 [Fulvitalea axinellae]
MSLEGLGLPDKIIRSLLADSAVTLVVSKKTAQDMAEENFAGTLFTKDQTSVYALGSSGLAVWNPDFSVPTGPLYKQCVGIWKRNGAPPYWVVADLENIEEAVALVRAVNEAPRVRGIVQFEDGEALGDVTWMEFPDLVTQGRFSYPTRGISDPQMSPHKAGFRFSPDIMRFNGRNRKTEKIFKAIPLTLEDDLQAHWLATGTAKVKNPEHDDPSHHNLEDPKAFLYDGSSSYTDCGASSIDLIDSVFTVSAMVSITNYVDATNRTHAESSRSILGKGVSFVIKLVGNKPTLTVVGQSDYIFNYDLSVNKWYRLTLVCVANRYAKAYVDGELIGTREIGPVPKNEYKVMIGSDLWDEFFGGKINDVLVWKRELSEEEVSKIPEFVSRTDVSATLKKYGFALMTLFVALIGAGIYYRKKKSAQQFSVPDVSRSPVTPTVSVPVRKPEPKKEENPSQIQLFGRFKVKNNKSEDVTKRFSPKIRQLLILLLIHERDGVSTKKLTETLWPEYDIKSAKNTRGTNIQKLKKALADVDGAEVEYAHKLWRVRVNSPYMCDYKLVSDTFHDSRDNPQLAIERLPLLLENLEKGRLVPNLNAPWLDHHIETLNDLVLDFCMRISDSLGPKETRLQRQLAEIIFLIDPVNEQALHLKIKALNAEGKHSLAKHAYERFEQEYEDLYSEEFEGEFADFL